MRRIAQLVVAVTLVAALPMPSAGAQVDAESAKAAKEIAAARKRANDAAAAYDEAVTALDALGAEIDGIRATRDEAQRRVDGLGEAVRAVAVRSYMHDDRASLVLLGTDIEEYNARVRATAMARFVAVGQTDAIDTYAALKRDLEAADGELALREQEQEAAAVTLDRRADALDAELAHLQQVEAARQAEVRRQREEAARKAAEEAARRAAEEAARKAAEAAAAAAARRTTPGTGTGSTPRSSAGTPASGTSGGTTPRSSSGGASASIVCPVAGPVAFGDTWGAARSGGRRHQGTDMMSPRGTPVVAPVSGTVQLRSVSLGGLSFYVYGDDGNTYFGTHMQGYEGASGRRVAAGEVVGYVGNTGNAAGGATHLHFEFKPGGGASVNPYSLLRSAC